MIKCREGRPLFIAESHCAVESWKNFSLNKEQGEASGIAGKRGGNSRVAKGGRIRDHGKRTIRMIAVPRVRSVDAKPDSGKNSNGPAQALVGASRSAPIACDGMGGGHLRGALPGDHTSAPIHKSGTR